MSKNLSEEYSKAVMNDLPDLWGKIEAELSLMESQKSEDESEEAHPQTEIKQFESKTSTKKKKPTIYKVIAIAGSLAAVFLVGVVAVSIISISMRFVNNKSNEAAGNMIEFQSDGACASDEDEFDYFEDSYSMEKGDIGNIKEDLASDTIDEILIEENEYETSVSFEALTFYDDGEETYYDAVIVLREDILNDNGDLVCYKDRRMNVKVENTDVEIVADMDISYNVVISLCNDDYYEAVVTVCTEN